MVEEDGNGDKEYIPVGDKTLYMYDKSQINIQKMDTQGNVLEGAVLEVTAKDDATFTPVTWQTTKEPKYFAGGVFKEGVTYVLTEKTAPDGYTVAESIEFTVDDEENLYVKGQKVENRRLVMLDYPIAVYINKLDKESNKPLAGAQMAIKDANGNVIHNFVSAAEPVLLPNTIFKAPKSGEMSYYVLAELQAPDGYKLAEDIAFAIDSKGNVYIKDENGNYLATTDNTIRMADEPEVPGQPGDGTSTTTTTTTIITTIPKTGDGTPLGTLMLLMVFGLAGAGMNFGLYIRRRIRGQRS